MINDNLKKISKHLFYEISQRYQNVDFELFLFGSSLNFSPEYRDVDFILIVPDNFKLTEICKTISVIIFELIIKYDKMITCFPIRKTDFFQMKSQFISNIWKEGINVKKFIG